MLMSAIAFLTPIWHSVNGVANAYKDNLLICHLQSENNFFEKIII